MISLRRLRVPGVCTALVLTACAPSKPPETVITIGGPAQTAPVVDASPGCPEGTHAEPDRGCVKDAVAVAADDDGEIGIDAEPQQNSPPVQPVGPPATSLQDLREPRTRRPPRALGLLSVEAQQLERLLSATPNTSPDRPKLLLRLAEEYVEMASAASREKANPTAATRGHAARQAAIQYYAELQKEFPKHCRQPNPSKPANATGCGDEFLYFIAYENEQLGQLDKARKAYYTLIQTWPQSRYLPFAYLAFGELFFFEAYKDPAKWAFAEQAYHEVLKFPPPENGVYGYALLRLGEVYQQKGEQGRARAMYEKLRQAAVQFPHGDAMLLPASLIPAAVP